MPDLWIYLDGQAVTQTGAAATGPVQTGDFRSFSNVPWINSVTGNAYDYCDLNARGSGGNPWGIGFFVDPDIRPETTGYCDTD